MHRKFKAPLLPGLEMEERTGPVDPRGDGKSVPGVVDVARDNCEEKVTGRRWEWSR